MADFVDESAELEELQRRIALQKAQQVKQDPLPDCEECGDPIPEERQQAIGARLCIGCAEFHEARGRHFRNER